MALSHLIAPRSRSGAYGRRGSPSVAAFAYRAPHTPQTTSHRPIPEQAATASAEAAAPALFEARLRTDSDRAAARAALVAAWGAPLAAAPPLRPSLAQLPGGGVRLERVVLAPQAGAVHAPAPRGAATAPGGAPLTLLPSQVAPFHALATALASGWMALLVGPRGCGKTSLARAAAAAARAPLVELSLAPSADTADLLGGYEQAEPARVVEGAVEAVAAAADGAAAVAASAAPSVGASAAATMLATLAAARRALDAAPVTSAHARLTAARALLDAAVAAGGDTPAAARAAAALSAAAARLATPPPPGAFEWVDGALTSAAAAGRWVLLDGANLAPPAVLDRLNPLLERGGALSLHEAGGGGGGARTVTPHPAFRLILALDPAAGDVSRAMRNRGVEVCVPPAPADGAPDAARAAWRAAATAGDAAAAAAAAGIPGATLPTAMAAAVRAAGLTGAPGASALRRWARGAAALAARGWPRAAALATAWSHALAPRDGGDAPFLDVDALDAAAGACAPLASALAWPTLPRAPWTTAPSSGAPAARDVALLASALAAAVAAELAGDGGVGLAAAARAARGAARAAVIAILPAAWLAAPPDCLPPPPDAGTVETARSRLRTVLALADERVLLDDGGARAARTRAAVARVRSALDALADAGAPAAAAAASALATCVDAVLADGQGVLSRARAALAAAHSAAACIAPAALAGAPLDAARDAGVRAALSAAGDAGVAALTTLDAASVRAAAARAAAVDAATLVALSAPPPPGARPSALQASTAAQAAGRGGGGGGGPAGWLMPALAAVSAVEAAALDAGSDAAWLAAPGDDGHPYVAAAAALAAGGDDDAVAGGVFAVPAVTLPSSLARLRAARRALLRVAHGGTGARGTVPAGATCPETLAAAWLEVEACALAVADAAGATAHAARVRAAGDGLTSALGLPDARAPPPLLWLRGGRPLAPRTEALAGARSTLAALARAASVGAAATATAARDTDLATATAAAHVAAALRDAGLAVVGDNDGAKLAAGAALAADARWAASLASGAAIVFAAACAPAGEGDAVAAAVPERVGEDAAAVVAASVAGGDVAAAAAAADADGGALGLPPALTADPHCRALWAVTLETRAAAAADAALPVLAAASGALAGAYPPPSPPAATAAAAAAIAACAGDTVSLAAALASLADAAGAGGFDARGGGAARAAARAATAEGWLAWHAVTAAAGADGAHVLAGAPGAAGVARRLAATTVSRGTPTTAAAADALELRLAARAARTAAATTRPRATTCSAQWACVGALAADIVAAHAAPGQSGAPLRAAAAALAAAGRAAAARASAAVLADPDLAALAVADPDAVGAACAASGHATLAAEGAAPLRRLAHTLAAAAAPSAPRDPLAPASLAALASAWACLGATRLALARPAGGADPAAAPARARAAASADAADTLIPAADARAAAQLAPHGPSEAGAIAAALGGAAAAAAVARDAGARAVARPTPPCYAAVRAAAHAFARGPGAPDRLLALLDAVLAKTDRAPDEAAAWRVAARAWSARAATLARGRYADVLGPLALAAAEGRAGLALAAAATALEGGDGRVLAASATARALAAWPPRAAPPRAAAAAASAASAAASAAGAPPGPAAAAARVRVALHSVTALARCVQGEAAATSALAPARPHLRSLLDEWARAREASEAAAAAADAVFKPARSRLADEGDAEDDADYVASFPDHGAAYADLLGGDDDGNAGDADTTAETDRNPPSTPPPPTADAVALDLVSGASLAALAAAHARLVGGCGGVSAQSDADAFTASFDAAASLLPVDAVLPPTLDDDADLTAGRLLRLATAHAALAPPVASATAAPPPPTDVRAPSPAELAMLVRALPPLRARLASLLAEWPGNPLLMRIDAAAARVGRTPAAAPLKAAMAGTDALLACCQLWQETAASAVKLDAQLTPLVALAARWRAAELAGWRRALDGVKVEAAAGELVLGLCVWERALAFGPPSFFTRPFLSAHA